MIKSLRHTRNGIGFVILVFALIAAPQEALAVPAGSAGCIAVNAGAFDATVTPLMYSSSMTQAGFAAGDRLDFTITAGGHSHFQLLPDAGAWLDNIVLGNETLLKSYTLTSTQLTLTLRLYADLSDDISVSATCSSAAPTVTAVSPNSGTTAGGTTVTITGTGFTGATAVTLGGVAASGFTVVDATTITATTPAHAAGAVDIQVTGPTGTGTGTGIYTYAVPAPAVTAISPITGASAGGTAVTITGTNFTGATAVTIGGAAATGISVLNATTITATAPAHAAGAADVVVVTPGGTGTGSGLYTYVDGPTIASVTPSIGPVTGGTAVTIGGADLTGATAVTIGGAAVAFAVVDSTTITATTPAHAAGAANVLVTTPGGIATGTGLYTYAAGPIVTGVAPAIGQTAGGTAVTISGANLTGATSVTFGGVAAASVVVVDATTITATTPAHAAGGVNVVVTTPGGVATGTGVYTYGNGPTIATISPSSGPAAGGTAIVIRGTGLAGATALRIGGEPASLTAVDSSTITATTPEHAAGDVEVLITTAAGSGTGTYTYIATLTLTSTASAATQVDQPYSQANVASGGTPPYRYTLSAGSLPDGVTLDGSTGLASGTPAAIGAFSYTIQVSDSGATPLKAAQSVSGVVAPILTTIAVTSSQNPTLMGEAVTFTATISPPPAAGTVRFDDGATALCDAKPLANGTATCVAAFAAAGAHSITAVYSGSAAHGASTSAVLMQTVDDQRAQTVEAIGVFMSRRNDLLAAGEPDGSRQIDRLIEVGDGTTSSARVGNGVTDHGGSFSTGAQGAASRPASGLERLPFRLTPPDRNGGGTVSLASGPVRASASWNGATRFGLATSLSRMLDRSLGGGQASRPATAALSRLDVWVDGRYGRFSDNRANTDLDGHFGLVSIGSDYVLGRRLLVGGMVQIDNMRQRSALQDSEARGHGWLAGPYATVRITDQLFWQARAAWGRSSNEVSPLQTYTDEFGSSRWLVSSSVAGRLAHGSWVLTPSASVAFIEDATSVYRDTFDVAIPEVTSRLGQARLGPQIEYRHRLSPRFVLAPHGTLHLVANFAGSTAAEGVGQIDGANVGPAGVRGRAELGTRVIGTGRFELDLSGSYDGIGASGYPAFGGRITVRMPLP